LWSVTLGAVVAQWTRQNASEATLLAGLPPTVNMTLVVNGTKQTGYAGVEATLTLDWSKILMNKAATSYTTVAATGIHSGNIVSTTQMDGFLSRSSPKATINVGSGETYTSLQSAFSAIYTPTTPFSRATYPSSDVCTFSNQKLFQLTAAHDEEITSYTASSVACGLLVPHFATVDLPAGGKIWMDGADTAPVLEAPHSCRIRGGGEIEQLGAGYCIHIDNFNALSVAGASSFQRYRLRTIIEDLTLRNHGTTGNSAMAGIGMSDGQTIIFRGVNFIREGTGLAPLVVAHTSPNCLAPGHIIFEDCYFNDDLIVGDPDGIQLVKSNVQTVRHTIQITNTTVGKVSAGNTAGGAAGWVRDGAFDPSIIYSPTLDP